MVVAASRWPVRGLLRRRSFSEDEPSILASREHPGYEMSVAWKPFSWDDSPGGREQDFLAWAVDTWVKPAGLVTAYPLYRLGCRHCGLSLLAGSPQALEALSSADAEFTCQCAMLLQGHPPASLCRNLQLSIVRSSEGLRHGRLSLVVAEMAGDPVSAARKIRGLMREEGQLIKGPLGGKSWNAQMALVGLSVLGLSTQVAPPSYLHEMMDLDAHRLQNRCAPVTASSQRLFDDEGNGRMQCNGIDLLVSQKVFVPRGESRHLVKVVSALKEFAERRLHFLDLTLGSGNILLALMKNHKSAVGFGIDICPDAVSLTQQNVKLHELEERARLAVHDLRLFNASTKKPDWPNRYDIIVANPPYSPDRSYRAQQHAEDLQTNSKHAKPLGMFCMTFSCLRWHCRHVVWRPKFLSNPPCGDQDATRSIYFSVAEAVERLLTDKGRAVVQVPAGDASMLSGRVKSFRFDNLLSQLNLYHEIP